MAATHTMPVATEDATHRANLGLCSRRSLMARSRLGSVAAGSGRRVLLLVFRSAEGQSQPARSDAAAGCRRFLAHGSIDRAAPPIVSPARATIARAGGLR